jgi:radical SAM protein with 4Fe4S-binding SPASM domain
MVESGLDELICSLHGASQQTFEIYQPGKSFRDTVTKIRRLIATRDSLGSCTPKIILNFAVTRFNEHEIPAFKRLARELKCRCSFATASLNVRLLPSNSIAEASCHITDRLNKWLPLNPDYVHRLYTAIRSGAIGAESADRFNGRKLVNCSHPWSMTIINWDGTVGPCCGAWSEADTLGDISIESLHNIWNGPRYRAARRSFKRRTDDNVPCAKCPGALL